MEEKAEGPSARDCSDWRACSADQCARKLLQTDGQVNRRHGRLSMVSTGRTERIGGIPLGAISGNLGCRVAVTSGSAVLF